MSKKIGSLTMKFDNAYVLDGYSVAGPKEREGPLGKEFDLTLDNDKFGEKTFEKAECKMFKAALDGVLAKSGIGKESVDAVLGGDLLNQIISTAFVMREFDSAFFGLYNACGTFAESLVLGACLIDGGFKSKVIATSGSHFSSAERQYRYPLELGVYRSPVSQWTATGAAATLLSPSGENAVMRITRALGGRVIDFGIKDVNNMGAAMAPAAFDTLSTFFADTGVSPNDYDKIFTGDLGKLGREILIDLFREKGIAADDRFDDCGAMLYSESQKTCQGGSGAACSAIVFNSRILNRFKSGEYKKVLLVGTGALLSTISSFQGESIPGIAHLVEVCSVY